MKTAIQSLVISLGLAALACTGPAPEGIYYASGKGSVTPDGLHRVKWEPFRITYVKPGADLQRYHEVLIAEVSISYKTPPRDGRFASSIIPNYALPASAVSAMKHYFHEEFAKVLAESRNFKVVDAPGPGVLLISGHILNLEIKVPPQQDQPVDETVYTQSPGQMTLVLDARDSVSGEALVRVGQAQAIEMSDAGWYQSDPVSNSAAVRESFQHWAIILREELDQFHALPALPPVQTAAPKP